MKRRALTGIPLDRLATHGDFAEAAALSQHLKTTLALHPKWERMSPEHREAFQMILFKISRAVCGNSEHVDHYDDIAGYAQLAALACKRRENHGR